MKRTSNKKGVLMHRTPLEAKAV